MALRVESILTTTMLGVTTVNENTAFSKYKGKTMIR